MKAYFLTAITAVLVLALLAGCSAPQADRPIDTEPAGTTTDFNMNSTGATTPAETDDNTQYEGDATSYYIDVVYTEQIDRYYTAISQQWDMEAYFDHEMSPLAAYYYEGKPLDNVGFTFMDLDGDGIWELIIGAIKNAAQDPLVFEIWALKDGEPVMIAQSGSNNRYYLQYAVEDNLWSVAYEAENNAANRAVYYLQLQSGEFKVTQGVVFDAFANEEAPWFMAYDLDWDVSNDIPIDEDTANAVLDAERNTYTAQEYFPYSLYK